MQRSFWFWIAFLGLGLAGLVLLLMQVNPGALAIEGNRMRLVYLGTLLVVLGGSVAAGWRGRGRLALKHALVWLAIGLGLVTVYSFRGEFEMLAARVTGELIPSRAVETAPGEITLRAGRDGHFHATGEVNGVPMQFLVDTGASDVALTEADARRLGIDFSQLRFTRIYSTANGRVPGARVVLDAVRIGSIEVNNVEASVTKGGGLEQSLLGMSFLGALGEVRFEGNRLVLRR